MVARSYNQQLKQTLKNEIYGEAIFTIMAKFSLSEEYRNKWLQLAHLESLTQVKLAPITQSISLLNRKTNTYMGYAVGFLSLFLPKSIFLKALLKEAERYLPIFRQLESLGPAKDRTILSYLTAHEQALADFAQQELAGHQQKSLSPILSMLSIGLS